MGTDGATKTQAIARETQFKSEGHEDGGGGGGRVLLLLLLPLRPRSQKASSD